jgi:hypothetical protein
MVTERPRLFERLKKGLEEGIEHEQGILTLRVTELVVPDPPGVYTAGDAGSPIVE